MKFIDAADQFKVAAKDESTILTDFSVKHHAYYITFVGVFREQMKFLDAADLYDTAASEESSLIQKFDVDTEWYYKLFGSAVQIKLIGKTRAMAPRPIPRKRTQGW
ncbi:hypothetical protein PF008_g29176 [Phytophthora fragariae]|uniref:Uncharacterized protein n=1 Tax=Phytophthora fragariae TaxID=53985 RepID=A0A6G0Q9W1_9STRA|nr:hypothetical protein PF008_g29176 [Phytophthora fragariae]